MTIRIIGKATTQRVTCPECLSILEFEPSDRHFISEPFGVNGQLVSVPTITCRGCTHVLRLANLEVRVG